MLTDWAGPTADFDEPEFTIAKQTRNGGAIGRLAGTAAVLGAPHSDLVRPLQSPRAQDRAHCHRCGRDGCSVVALKERS